MDTKGFVTRLRGVSLAAILTLSPQQAWAATGLDGAAMRWPHALPFAGLLLSITILSINLIGDAVRDALDPRMKQREGK